MDISLREEEARQQDGRDRGAILITYPAPPEDTVVEYFRNSIPLTGLALRNIDVPIEHGHPLYQEGVSKTGPNSKFPKIGIECTTDRNTQFLGLNEHHFKNSENFRKYLTEISELPESQRLPTKSFLDEFSRKKNFQQLQYNVESEVVICGFATGNAGRNTNKWIYDASLAVTMLMANDLPVLYPGLTVYLPEDTEPNLSTADFSEPFWGFEIRVRLVQTKSIFRTKPSFLFPDIRSFDVFLSGSKTRLEGHFGLEDKP